MVVVDIVVFVSSVEVVVVVKIGYGRVVVILKRVLIQES